MAVRRTSDEIIDIVNHCVELENAGGDILGYLWEQDYLTPRATWFNFQREYLGRKRPEYTDGKPKRSVNMAKRVYLTDAQKAEAVRIAIEGKDPKVYLDSLGVGDSDSMWSGIKAKYRVKHPEIYAKIPKFISKPGPKHPRKAFKTYDEISEAMKKVTEKEQPAVLKVDGPIRIETPESNMVKVVETPERLEMNEIKNEVKFGEYQVTAIRHPAFGEFYHDQKFECIDWRTPEGEEVSLKPEYWLKFAEAIPEIIGVLGVRV